MAMEKTLKPLRGFESYRMRPWTRETKVKLMRAQRLSRLQRDIALISDLRDIVPQ
jgi:hypothetical protein